MLSRVLLDNERWYFTVAWLGMGKVSVTKKATGQRVTFPPVFKSYLISTLEAMATMGHSVESGSPKTTKALEFFAGIFWQADDIVTRAAMAQTPEALARAIIEGDD